MTPIETGQSEKLDVCAAIFGHDTARSAAQERDALLAVVRRAQAILAEGLATSQSTTARGGPLALGQAAKLALDEINASGVLT